MIVSSIDSSSIKDGLKVTEEHTFEKFTSNIKRNLRIVLCLKNSPENLRRSIRLLPSLATCTVGDWYSSWREDELYTVAKRHLKSTENGLDDSTNARVTDFCTHLHMNMKHAAKGYYQVNILFNFCSSKIVKRILVKNILLKILNL